MPKLPENIVIPPAIDIHTHVREPSPENDSENFDHVTRSALMGGYLMISDMPNNPGRPTWTYERSQEKQGLIDEKAHVYAGIYAGSQPEQDNTAELAEMAKISLGIKGYLGKTTGNTSELSIRDIEERLQAWHDVAPEQPIMIHRGSADLEEIIRVVADYLEHRLHICHVSDPAEAELIDRMNRQYDLDVTCGVCLHHLVMTSHDVHTKGSVAEMMPKLATQVDSEKLMHQTASGLIHLIETDHAPHPPEKKYEAEHSKEEDGSIHCFGVPGIMETVPQLLNMVRLGRLILPRMVELVSTKPAEVIGVNISHNSYVAFSNELYRIEETPEVPRGYLSPYVGNFAVGKLLRASDKDGLVYDRETNYQRRVSRPFVTRGATI